MKIGLVNIGSYHGAIKQYVKRLTANFEGETFYKVAFDNRRTKYEWKPLASSRQTVPELKTTRVTGNTVQMLADSVEREGFSHVIVIGPVEKAHTIHEALKKMTTVLFVPASEDYSPIEVETTLGYDTALNSIVKSILQIGDTAGSLVREETRVFSIQVPGTSNGQLIHDVAMAVDGIVLPFFESETDIETVRNEIIRKRNLGETYVMLLMSHEVDIVELNTKLSTLEKLEFREVTIDEAQCIGPYPSARDRVLAQRLADETLDWLNQKEKSGWLLFRNNKIFA